MTSSWRIAVTRHGAERQPVVVIDGFAPDPTVFVEDASMLAFRPLGEHYPGVRAVVADVMLRPLLAGLAPVVEREFGLHDLTIVDAFYSLVTTRAAALRPIQRMPHFDEVAPTRLALLHFLSADETSGTAFFRQRSTGMESVDAARLPSYRTALERDIAAHGMPEAAYIAGDTPIFEELAFHRGIWNRAILYRSNTLHCARIPPEMMLSDNPASGRLTVNTFLDGRA